MKTVEIQGQVRTDLGKRATASLRKEGFVPAVIYGGSAVVHFSALASTFKDVIYTSEFKKTVIVVDGKSYEAVVKDRQFDPLTSALTHVDFYEMQPGKRMQASLPVRLVGTAKGVREGGTLLQKVRYLTVQTTPEVLPDAIELDITELSLGKSARVRDVKAIEGLTIMQAPSIPIISVEIPRALRSAQSKAATETVQK